MNLLLLAAATLLLGVCVGMSGYGGFLVPPLLVWLAAFDDPRRAVAHALVAASVPALLGAILYRRRHRIPLLLVVVLCAGTVPGIVAGKALTSVVPATGLQVLIGAAVLAAGLLLLVRPAGAEPATSTSRPGWLVPLTLGAGVLSGVAGVVVGVGGPLVTTPLLLAGGVALAPAVGAGLANSVLVCLLGAGSLLTDVTLDATVVVVTAVPQLVGVVLGVWLHPRVDAVSLTRVVSAVAVVVGIGFIFRAAS
jgi:uncharacterized protein